MSISCFCSHCGARIRAPEKAAGRKAKCPKCRAETVVPTLQAKDSPKDTKSVPEALPVELDAPQVKHWSAPPPVRLPKVSEDKVPPKDVRGIPEVLPIEEDEILTVVPAEPQRRTVRRAEDDEVEPPRNPRPRLVYGLMALVGLGATIIACTIVVASIATQHISDHSRNAPPSVGPYDVGTEAEAIKQAKDFVDFYAYGKGSTSSILPEERFPIWRAGDNCSAFLRGNEWTVHVPIKVVDWTRYKGEAGPAFFRVHLCKGRYGWEDRGMKYVGRSDR